MGSYMRYDLNEGPTNPTGTLATNGELSRLITAAVVNQQFCDLLLADPRLALAGGYKGEVFHLTAEEYRMVLSIRATSLAEFARQLVKNSIDSGPGPSPNGNGSGHRLNGNSRENGSNGKDHNGNTNGTSK